VSCARIQPVAKKIAELAFLYGRLWLWGGSRGRWARAERQLRIRAVAATGLEFSTDTFAAAEPPWISSPVPGPVGFTAELAGAEVSYRRLAIRDSSSEGLRPRHQRYDNVAVPYLPLLAPSRRDRSRKWIVDHELPRTSRAKVPAWPVKSAKFKTRVVPRLPALTRGSAP